MKVPLPLKDFLPIETVKQLSQLVAQPSLVNALRETAQKLGFKDQFQAANLQQILRQAGEWFENITDPWMANVRPGMTPGINATGELISSRWCSNRMHPTVIALTSQLQSRFADSAKLDTQLRNLLLGVTGAQSVLVLPSMTTAFQLVAMARQSIPNSKWVLPRMECIRLTQTGNTAVGSLRDLLDACNSRTVEVGTSQDCSIVEFENAQLNAESLIVVTSPSAIRDSHADERYRVAREAAEKFGASVIEIVHDGAIHDLTVSGIPGRMLNHLWNSATRLALVPGDALLGGPECGILLGNRDFMMPIQRLADSLGWHANSITKFQLLATLQHAESIEGWRELPIGAALTTSCENLENRAQRLAIQLQSCDFFERVQVSRKPTRIGAGVWAFTKLDSAVVQLFPKSISASALSEKLTALPTPVWCNVQSDHLECVIRSIEPDEDRILVQQLTVSPGDSERGGDTGQ